MTTPPDEGIVKRTPHFEPLPQQIEELTRYVIIQEVGESECAEWTDLALFNPLTLARRFEPLESKIRKKGKEERTEKEERKVLEITRLTKLSEEFQRRNPELQARSLRLLRERLTKSDTRESIRKKTLEAYADYSLADEALDFLLETTQDDLRQEVLQAKEELNAVYDREIKAGKNIGAQARAFSQQGLGSPTALRDLYRDITGNPRPPAALFTELNNLFTFEKLKTVIEFILHALGSDLKAKGPSIPAAELYRLMTEARTLQAILGVYRFFKSRMRLILSFFERQSLALPNKLTFELLSKQFISYLQERYPSSEKLFKLALPLGISEELLAQIIIYTQLRDAVRQVAPKLFRSDQHRHDVLLSFFEVLEELEERLEEEKEKKKKKEEEDDDGPV